MSVPPAALIDKNKMHSLEIPGPSGNAAGTSRRVDCDTPSAARHKNEEEDVKDFNGSTVVKEEPLCQDNVDESMAGVKEESSCEDNTDEITAPALAALYHDHVVKDELVLGPELPHRPVTAVVNKSRAPLVRDCFVQLERCAAPCPAPQAPGGNQRHSRLIHIRKTFQCNHCDYKCSHKSHLRTHMMKHTGEKPFQCRHCGYKCIQKTHLLIHQMIHTGEKPFQCSHCDYKCRHRTTLKTHVMKHTGEKPFHCSHCDYKCSQKANLLTHQMTHTGKKPFHCSHCDYKCRLRTTLRTHLMIHTGEKPFKCSHCDYKCRRKTDLKTHQIVHTRKTLM